MNGMVMVLVMGAGMVGGGRIHENGTSLWMVGGKGGVESWVVVWVGLLVGVVVRSGRVVVEREAFLVLVRFVAIQVVRDAESIGRQIAFLH